MQPIFGTGVESISSTEWERHLCVNGHGHGKDGAWQGDGMGKSHQHFLSYIINVSFGHVVYAIFQTSSHLAVQKEYSEILYYMWYFFLWKNMMNPKMNLVIFFDSSLQAIYFHKQV